MFIVGFRMTFRFGLIIFHVEHVMDATREPIRILVVIVLYGIAPRHSTTYTSLLGQNFDRDTDHAEVGVVIFDNTENDRAGRDEPQDNIGCDQFNIVYVKSNANVGVSGAYNHALERAAAAHYQWIITLDQDSVLPANYLRDTIRNISSHGNDASIGAFLPRVVDGGKQISPIYFACKYIRRTYNGPEGASDNRDVYAVNSGAALRTSSLMQCGGYSSLFWLDKSDYYIFDKLRGVGKSVYVAPNITISHSLSLSGNSMSPARYRNFIDAEGAYEDLLLYSPVAAIHLLRCMVKAVKTVVRFKSLWQLRILGAKVIGTLSKSRRVRLKQWIRATRKLGFGVRQNSAAGSLDISVCMATYNGEKYVGEQISSILAQLGSNDELVIIDDCSTDSTRKIIQSFHEPRIRLFTNRANQGVVWSFERAIKNATGKVIFFSDQDDIWAPDKVDSTMKAFRARKDVSVVCSGKAIIDAGGAAADNCDVACREFSDSLLMNFMSNRYQASTMAFRATLLPYILPFPKTLGYLYHDDWIGVVAPAFRKRTAYIDKPLVFYRRHGENCSKKLPVRGKITKRLVLAWKLTGKVLSVLLFRRMLYALSR